jgi:hypothetical protein
MASTLCYCLLERFFKYTFASRISMNISGFFRGVKPSFAYRAWASLVAGYSEVSISSI